MSKELETLKHLIYTGNTQEHSVALDKIDIDKCFDTIEKGQKLFDDIVEYFMRQENIECLFRNALLGKPYQTYCENCKDKLTNPIYKETYDDLSIYFKKKEEELLKMRW